MQQNRDGEQKSFRLYGLFSIFLVTAFTSLFAGDFEKFKTVPISSFVNYKDKKDNKFERYLKSQWREYKASSSKKFYEDLTPKIMLSADATNFLIQGPYIHLQTKKSIQKKVNFTSLNKNGMRVKYFGSILYFSIDQRIEKAHFHPQNIDGILNVFSIFASSDYEPVLHEIKDVCKKMQLNDWGMFLLIQKISAQIFDKSDEKKLFSWFLLNKLGYDTHIAMQDGHIVLLSRTKQFVYLKQKYIINKKRYYSLLGNSKNIVLYSYSRSYPNAVKSLDFTLKTLPKLAQNMIKKTKVFSFLDKTYSISYSYNKNLIDFMKAYPAVNEEIFLNAPIQENTLKDIVISLKPYLNNKKMSFGINFILRFVQNAFVYERDKEHFNKIKEMFAQETLVYDRSDAKDRVNLYANLIRELFGIKVLGVKYKNHMVTALRIPIDGDSIKIKGKKYIIADPTYSNANVGESMQKYMFETAQRFIYFK